ncbi:MAG: PTS sugar transporter subunit IIA [candidate division WOR-3 bacterium]
MEKRVFKPALAVLDKGVNDLDEAGRLLLSGMRVKTSPEDLIATFIGGGVSILHARDWVDLPILGFMRPVKPFKDDGAEVRYVFLVISPKEDPDAHLIALARVARIMTDKEVRESLDTVSDSSECLGLLEKYSV